MNTTTDRNELDTETFDVRDLLDSEVVLIGGGEVVGEFR